MTTAPRLLSATLTILAIPVLAPAATDYTYAMFEVSVPHIDLETCPATVVTGEPSFCRVTVSGDAVHVYAFSEDGDQPLLAVKTFYEGEYDLVLE